MKLLITGSTGFVGRNLVRYLDDEYCLAALNRNPDRGVAENYLWNNFESLSFNNFNAIIHLTGKAHDVKNIEDEKTYFEINFELTKNLFNQFLSSNCTHFIYISSVKAAADIVDGILTEDVAPQPHTAYGKSKLQAEKYLLEQKLPQGKYVYVLRPCMIHGPENKGNLNLLYRFVKKGFPYPLGAFENKRSFLSINNLCFVIKELLRLSIPSGVYNVADDEFLSTKDVVRLIAASQKKRLLFLNIPSPLIKFVAYCGNLLNLPLNSERLTKLSENYIVSNNKIKSALKIKNMPLSINEGMMETFRTFNNN